MPLLFPFAEYWWFYAGFTGFVLLLLALDLGIFHRQAHVVSFRESLTWSIIWVATALAFNYGFYLYAASKFGGDVGQQVGLEFLTGYIVEKSLAVDNVFVFVLVFAYFSIPTLYQHRVLFYGILGALVFRAIFVALGSVLMQYWFVVAFFGVLLIATGIKMLWSPDQKIEPEKNPVVRLLRRVVPIVGGQVDGVGWQGRVLPGGADFQLILADRTQAHLDARYVLELEDGARIWVHNTALRVTSAEDGARLIQGQAVDPDRVYFRCQPRFEAAHPQWQWLAQHQFIGVGLRLPDAVHLSIYQVN